MPRSHMSTARRRRHIVALIAILFIAVASTFAVIVFRSIDTILNTANQIDDARAVDAARGAVDALRSQLSGTIHDNATWDGAYKQLNSITRRYWILENWALTASDNPLYDTAVVIDVRGKVIVAYKDGNELGVDPAAYFGPDLNTLIGQAYNVRRQKGPVPVQFIQTKGGIAVVGAATIRPRLSATRVEEGNLYVLIFARHLTPKVVNHLARAFRIDGMTLNSTRDQNMLNVPLSDVWGRDVAYLSWPSKRPGSQSFLAVRTQLAIGFAILMLFLAQIVIVGFAIIRKLREDEAASRHKALHDPLTGLANRAGFTEFIQEAVSDPNGSIIQLHLLDLDGFKAVNDTWGHGTGDNLLVAVAQRLRTTLSEPAFIARLGGDEFAIVTVAPQGAREREAVPDIIQRAVSTPFEINGRFIQIGGSVGVSVAQDASAQTGELMRTADIALYQAKDFGRGMTVFYDQALGSVLDEQSLLEEQLRQTLCNEGIDVRYQPLVDARSHSLRGVEVLARWCSPTLGPVGPDSFIPIAEKTGLIDMLGLQVLEKATAAAAMWPAISVCLNVSPLQLKDQYFVNRVAATLDRAGLSPKRLTLEITEGVLITEPDQAHRAIAALKALGVKVALDDFGIGYASIGALRRLGFDRLKIDKSLTAELDKDPKAAGVFQATVALANSLEIPVTAEGIETEAQAVIAKLSGCDLLQGYLFGKPVTGDEITAQYFGSPPIYSSGQP
ncbi:EAL domain-containing protein [Rhizobium sp. Leaf391]|uniref:bifunctional diguanylate cyclase/phosphodiesterase n=1 Tax=Rhizobium sp. Leaf391 TaxID=1736360 RepID=UPI0009E72CA7|nr:EAL domain-containing protein [Rhizobium sp. Leaf391]